MQDRKAILGKVSPHMVHPLPTLVHGDEITDDCVVEVISFCVGGSGRSLVKCLFTHEKAKVPSLNIRPF